MICPSSLYLLVWPTNLRDSNSDSTLDKSLLEGFLFTILHIYIAYYSVTVHRKRHCVICIVAAAAEYLSKSVIGFVKPGNQHRLWHDKTDAWCSCAAQCISEINHRNIICVWKESDLNEKIIFSV